MRQNPTNLECGNCNDGELESGESGFGFEYYSCPECGGKALYVNTGGTAFEPTKANGWFGCHKDAIDKEIPDNPVQG